MKKNDIIWNPDGWTQLDDADGSAHKLEISALTEDGKVVEVRLRHNDGEEIVLNGKIDDAHTLPMAFKEFKKAFLKDQIKFRQ